MRTLKQKKWNRLLAALLAVAMMFQMLPLMVFADEGTGSTAGKAWIGITEYPTLSAAVNAANNGDTITLGEGEYSLNGTQRVTNKSLTFVGVGTEKTTWKILAPQTPYGADGWCDYSFDGSDSITFQDMTVIGSVYPDGTIKANDTQGLIRVQNITLKDCIFNGRADYWGYATTTFENVTFNAPGTAESGIDKTDYSLWTYTGKTYTFKNCTFNSVGKIVSVYRHHDSGYDVTVNFEDCIVKSSTSVKQALTINDSTFENSKYILNITNPQVTAALDNTTCSQVFGFGGKASTNNKSHTDVTIDGVPVWSGGKMLTHSYTDGEKELAYDITYSDWTKRDERNDVRDVTRTCRYCGWKDSSKEWASVYSLQYDLNEGVGAEGADYSDAFYREKENVTIAAAPSREGYHFVGWKDLAGKTYAAGAETVLTGDTVLTAQWKTEDDTVVHILKVTGGTVTAQQDGVELALETSLEEGALVAKIPEGAVVTVELDKDAVPQNMEFERWSLDDDALRSDLDALLGREVVSFTMPDHDLSVEAMYKEPAVDGGDSSIIGTVVIGAAGAAVLGWGAYQLGTEFLMKYYGLPYFPSNRSVLAMMLWEDAGKPMPTSALLYPDVGQEERDMDLQHAARWAMENQLMPDLNSQEGLTPEEIKFYPDNAVSKIRVLRAWRKAQALKQKA